MSEKSTMDGYWAGYCKTGTATSAGNSTVTNTEGYSCYHCGEWINWNQYHDYCPSTYRTFPYYSPPENKTEKAFRVLKLLVEEKFISEPKTFKIFCDLVEKIAKTI